jgi:DNA primase large subunit
MIMVRAAFINPLSEEGKEIVRELRDLNRVFDEIEELIETVIESKS